MVTSTDGYCPGMVVELADHVSLEAPLDAISAFEYMIGPKFASSFVNRLIKITTLRLKKERFLQVRGGRAARVHLFPYYMIAVPNRGPAVNFGITPPYAFREVGKKCPEDMYVPPFNQLELQFKSNDVSCEVILLADALFESAIERFRIEHGRQVEDYAQHADKGELDLLKTFFGYKP